MSFIIPSMQSAIFYGFPCTDHNFSINLSPLCMNPCPNASDEKLSFAWWFLKRLFDYQLTPTHIFLLRRTKTVNNFDMKLICGKRDV